MTEDLEPVIAVLSGHLPHLFAVVDPAREPGVLEWLNDVRLPFQCLFQGEKAVSLAEEAPYLVQFGQDGGALRKLVQAHHGGAAVTYLVSDAPFYVVRRHLRRIQMVKTDDDETLFFRYYDPRIARVFLPTCDEEQIRWMFGEVVQRWVTEGADGARLVEHYVTADDGGATRRVGFDRVA
ncbi:MAG: DUF4123 domain-containing protein [Polyangiaceae bacterium]